MCSQVAVSTLPFALENSEPSMIPLQPVVSHPQFAPLVSPLVSIPSIVIPSLPVVTPDRAELSYDPYNPQHEKIVNHAAILVKAHAINTRTVSTQSIRKAIVLQKLRESAAEYYGHQGKPVRIQSFIEQDV